MYIGLHVKYRLVLSDFNETWIFWAYFLTGTQISNFMKIRPVGAELFHVDGRTDTTKLIVASGNSAKAPSKTMPRTAGVVMWRTDWLRVLSSLYNYLYLVADLTAAVNPVVSVCQCLGMWTYYKKQACSIQKKNWNSARRDQQSSNSKCQHMGTSFTAQTSAT